MIEANNFAVGMIEWYGKRWQQEKGWAKEKQSPPLSKAQSLGRASHKGKGNQKIVKNGRQTVQANHGKCKQQQADFGHTWKRGTHKTQTSQACTQPIQDTVRSWVRGKRAWFNGGERGKTYFKVPAQALLGEVSYWDGIPSKRSKTKLELLGACHEGQGERKHPDHSRKGCYGKQTNKIVFFCPAIGSGTQTDQWWSQIRQRLLRAKIIKFSHSRHCKRAIAMYRRTTSTTALGI